MKIMFLFILLGILSVNTFAQNWNKLWEKQLGSKKMDFFIDVIEDKNKGYTVLGSKWVNGNSYDFWVLRFNDNGDTIWTKTLGTEHRDIPQKIAQLYDGTYLLMGSVNNDNSQNLIVIRADIDGNKSWFKDFDGDVKFTGGDISAVKNEGFVITGSKGDDPNNKRQWIIKMDLEGNTIWEKTFNENLAGCVRSIKKLPIGGFAVASQVSEIGKKDCDIMVHQLNDNGDLLWSSRIKSPGLKVWPECLCCSPDSCFMLVGWQGMCLGDINAEDPIFDFDLVLNKIDCKGNVLWTKNIDKEGSEGGNAVSIRPDGNFIVAGIKVTSFIGKIGPWLLLIDQDGNTLGEKLLDFHFTNDHAVKVINCTDGGFIVIGPGIQDDSNTRSDGWIMKFASL